MAYDEVLAGRVRDRLADLPGVTAKRMFGALAFLTDGRLTVGVTGGRPDGAGSGSTGPATSS